jgi:hypothetical protein
MPAGDLTKRVTRDPKVKLNLENQKRRQAPVRVRKRLSSQKEGAG